MSQLLDQFAQDEPPGAGWAMRSRPTHPLMAGAAAVAIAVGAWHGLLWNVRRESGGRAPAVVAAPAETGDVTPQLEPGPPEPERPLNGQPAAVAPPDSQPRAAKVESSAPKAETLAPVTTPRPHPQPLATPADTGVTVPPRVRTDSSSQSVLSPFRRSHPWAATPGGQYYYPTNCPATLRLPDLVFFRSEAEARAQGFILNPGRACR